MKMVTQEKIINVNDEIDRMINYMSSKEGRRKLEEGLRAAQDASNQLREAGRIPRHRLYEPINLMDNIAL